MCPHELILGETIDFITGETLVDTIDERARQKFITGETLVDTIDERARQKIARFLVEEKGYSKAEIQVRRQVTLDVDGNRETSLS
jgi:hypothetical protein